MSVEPEVLEALDLKQLDVPDSLPITAIEVEDYVDWTGDDSLRMTLVLDESFDPTKIGRGDSLRLKSQIRDRLIARGVPRFAYIRLVKESERQQDAE